MPYTDKNGNRKLNDLDKLILKDAELAQAISDLRSDVNDLHHAVLRLLKRLGDA